MIIAARFSFKSGQEAVREHWPHLLAEIEEVVASVSATEHLTKSSREKTMPGRMLYSPVSLNRAFKKAFFARGWQRVRVRCEYPTDFYVREYDTKPLRGGAFREMDFVKERLGVEVQMGKYSFMVYNIAAKMTIFHNLGHIDAGVEVVPMKAFADSMSTGVSYFEQLVWDLQARGIADIDIPVLVLGLDADLRGDPVEGEPRLAS